MVTLFPVAYERGQGVTLTDVDGNTYIDFSSGIVITNLGHAHPVVAEAIARAASELDNVHDFATPFKVRAMEALESITPPGLSLFTFFSSGTEAVEGAMRVARAATGRMGFVSFHRDFHGRTGGSASITAVRASNGPRDPMTMLVPNGHCYRCSFHLEPSTCGLRCAGFVGESIEQNMPGQVAAVVGEVITNANGATVYQPGYLTALQKEAHASGALLVADEVATGFGRTGAWFAVNHEGVVPDIMAIGKGMGNGFPVTAIAVREDLGDALAASFPSTSYGGNPMACAAVGAVVEVMQRERPRRPRRRPRRVRPRPHGRAGRAAPDRGRRAGQGRAARHRAREGPPVQGAVRRRRQLRLPPRLRPRRGVGDGREHPADHAADRDVDGGVRQGLEIVEEAIAAAEKEFGYA